MSSQELLHRIEEEIRKFNCDHCGAIAGEPCVAKKSGRVQSFGHSIRYQQALDAGTVPIGGGPP